MKVKCDGREFEIKKDDNGKGFKKEFKFEMRSRRRSIVWGVAFLAAALLLIAGAVMDTMGINAEIPFFRIALCGLLLGLVVKSLTRGAIAEIFFPIAFIFMLLEGSIIGWCGLAVDDIMNNWLVLLCALLFTIAAGCLFSKKLRFGVKTDGVGGKSFGSTVKYIDCAVFKNETVENNMGSTSVYFENPEAYAGDGVLYVENNMGAMKINVPAGWFVETKLENNMGSVKIPSRGEPNGKKLTVAGENNMGSLEVIFERSTTAQ